MPSLATLLARHRHDHSDVSLAQTIGVSITAIRGVEAGRTPNVRTIDKFANFLGLTVAQLQALTADAQHTVLPGQKKTAGRRSGTHADLLSAGRQALTILQQRLRELETWSDDPLMERLRHADAAQCATLLQFLELMDVGTVRRTRAH